MTNTYTIKNDNYAAQVVALSEFKPLEGCDNVQAAIIDFNQVIVSKSCKPGDVGIFFPLECAIHGDFLAGNNLFSKSELNADPLQKGFFEVNGRVKAKRFRGHRSDGFFIPLEAIKSMGLDPKSFQVGDRFQTVNGIEVCRKYFVEPKTQEAVPNKKARKALKKSLKTCIVPGQLAFHYDTAQARRNAHRIRPEDVISISDKWHGTSAIIGNLLLEVPYPTESQKKDLATCEEMFNRIERGRKALKGSWAITRKVFGWGLDLMEGLTIKAQDAVLSGIIKSTEYGMVAASRTVVKTAGPQINTDGGFYGEDIWTTVCNEIGYLPEGFTVYGEIVGFLGSGTHIQKGYDYGCAPKEHKFLVYRVTETDRDGNVRELDWAQMGDFCTDRGLQMVYEFFHGTAQMFVEWSHPNAVWTSPTTQIPWQEIVPLDAPQKPWKNPMEIEDGEDHTEGTVSFAKLFMEAIEHTYLEKDCGFCTNKVPNEGVVIRVDTPNGRTPFAIKAKSYRFFEAETKAADKGEVNIEDQEAQAKEVDGE